MSMQRTSSNQCLPQGVMLNAYPDSIGERLSDLVALLQRTEFERAFSLLYILPTFFNSDLDRGFSIIDYGINQDLVSNSDIQALQSLGIGFKFDLVMNHLSVASPQFKDLLAKGDASDYRDFFIDWNAFWRGHGQMSPEGHIVPDEASLSKLFMRKPGLPILQVRFPDGSDRPYWNTFYQEISYGPVAPEELMATGEIGPEPANKIATMINGAIENGVPPVEIDLDGYEECKDRVLSLLENKRSYLGQMDLNARSEQVWSFYDETLAQLRDYGGQIIRLDAFAYLHKEPGEANFFNEPGTWDYLARLREMAAKHGLQVFPEVHAEYGKGLHEAVAERGYPIYDFFFPGLVLDALQRGTSRHLLQWIHELLSKGMQCINMLGCHDGIPVLDLRGGTRDGQYQTGLLSDEEIDGVMQHVIGHGGRVKNLFGPDGKKIAYYQVNATFFSALGEHEPSLLLARAIQLFMPGLPQIWYLDLFAGKNDYAAADQGGAGGHKEINRTNLSTEAIEAGLARPIVQQQLALIRLRNQSSAFAGSLHVEEVPSHQLRLRWSNAAHEALLHADLSSLAFRVTHRTPDGRWEFEADGVSLAKTRARELS